MEFQYNKEERAYFLTKKLENGYVARIYFISIDIPTSKMVAIHNCYEVALAIAKSKKDLNNWIFGTGEHRINDLTGQYKEFGISVLLWAKEMVYEFFKNRQYQTICVAVFATNNRRFKIYKHWLKDFQESSFGKDKFLYKISNK